MVDNGVAKVVVEFLKVRDQRTGTATELVPNTTATALAKQGMQIAFRTPDVDFVPLSVSWFRLVLERVLVCVRVRVRASVQQRRLGEGLWQHPGPRISQSPMEHPGSLRASQEQPRAWDPHDPWLSR